MKKIILTEEQLGLINNIPSQNDIDKIADQDRERLYQLKFGNHPRRDFFIKNTIFGNGPTYFKEAAFQLLGYDRFGMDDIVLNNEMMDNPWDDIFHILQWAIKYKNLNPIYLRRVSNKDWESEPDELGLQPDIMQNDEWDSYIKDIKSGKQRLFSSEELKEISSLLPTKLKEALYNDIINIRRIDAVNNTVNHILVMNDGENAEKFLEICRRKAKEMVGAGQKFNQKLISNVVRYALQQVPLLADNINKNALNK
jgi:hypothetical protein